MIVGLPVLRFGNGGYVVVGCVCVYVCVCIYTYRTHAHMPTHVVVFVRDALHTLYGDSGVGSWGGGGVSSLHVCAGVL